jgi:hypothetical protein
MYTGHSQEGIIEPYMNYNILADKTEMYGCLKPGADEFCTAVLLTRKPMENSLLRRLAHFEPAKSHRDLQQYEFREIAGFLHNLDVASAYLEGPGERGDLGRD